MKSFFTWCTLQLFNSLPELFTFFSFEKFELLFLIYFLDDLDKFLFKISKTLLFRNSLSTCLKLIDELIFKFAHIKYKIFFLAGPIFQDRSDSFQQNWVAIHVLTYFTVLTINRITYKRYLWTTWIYAHPFYLLSVAK